MKRILIGLVLVFVAQGVMAQCTGSFNDTANVVTPNPYDIIYTNTSTPTSATFNWTFTGGTPSTANSVNFSFQPIVAYPGPGTYAVTLSVFDTNLNCTDTLITTVTVPGSPMSCNTFGDSTPCGQCTGTAQVTVANGVAPYSYLWSTGDTLDSITGLCAGIHTVTVTDAFAASTTCTVQIQNTGFSTGIVAVNNGACPGDSVTIISIVPGSPHTYLWSTGSTDSTITVGTAGLYTVTVTDSSGCVVVDSIAASFSPLSVSTSSTNETCVNCCDGSVTAAASGTNGYSYLWNTNATSSTVNGLCAGTYTVTVTDSAGCQVIGTASVFTGSCYSISGNVDQGVEPTRVYLIEESNNFLTATDSSDTDSLGNYTFNGVCNGIYYVKAALLPAHTSYNAFIPTYYDTAAIWSQANALIVAAAGYSDIDIVMLGGTNSGGPGFVGGLISQGANRDEGDPVPNAQLILTDENEEVIDFTRSGLDGTYDLSDLPYGSYKLYVDILNKTSYPLTFTLSADQPTVTNGNFIVYSDYIKPELPAGLNNAFDEQTVHVYPNPSDGLLNLEAKEVIEKVTIYSLLGRELAQLKPGSDRVQLHLNKLVKGTYLLYIEGENFSAHHVWVKE